MLLVETSKGVRTIALNRPEALNAFNQQMWVDLCRALVAARDDNNAKVLVVTGTGRAFSAGADLNEKGQKTENSDKPSAGVAQLVELIIDFPKQIGRAHV